MTALTVAVPSLSPVAVPVASSSSRSRILLGLLLLDEGARRRHKDVLVALGAEAGAPAAEVLEEERGERAGAEPDA
eukprot:COSAG04_NODE_4636_length_1981_cov_3.612646_1_plen_75_part_10